MGKNKLRRLKPLPEFKFCNSIASYHLRLLAQCLLLNVPIGLQHPVKLIKHIKQIFKIIQTVSPVIILFNPCLPSSPAAWCGSVKRPMGSGMAGRAGVKQLQPRLDQNSAPKCTKALKNAQNTRIFEDCECPIQIVQHMRDACILVS